MRLRFGLAFLWIASLWAQTPVYTVTPSLVTVQVGTDLYCGLRSAGTVLGRAQDQVYCFVTTVTPFDTLILNLVEAPPLEVFSANAAMNLKHSVIWLVFQTPGSTALNWQVAIDGFMNSGVFGAAGPAPALVLPPPGSAVSTTLPPPGYKSPVPITLPTCGPYSPNGCPVPGPSGTVFVEKADPKTRRITTRVVKAKRSSK